MKKIAVLICCTFINISPVWACSYVPPSYEYKFQNNQIYYLNNHKGNPLLIEGADKTTFQCWGGAFHSILPDDTRKNWSCLTSYTLDANHVYYEGKKLQGLDPTKAKLLKNAHSYGATIEGLSNPASTTDGYAKDDKLVYYQDQLLTEANGAQFVRLPLYLTQRNGSHYAKDEKQIYFYGEKIAGNPKTAIELYDGYYLDDQHIYFRGEVLKGALPDQFEQRSGLIISNGHVFYRNERLPLDGHSFQELDARFFVDCASDNTTIIILKDKNGTYKLEYSGEILHTSYKFKTLEDPTKYSTQPD